MMLPDGLEWVLEMLGFDWPKADEDKLRECAQVWRDFADQVDEINYQALSAASSVRSANLGDDIDAFGKAFDKFTTGGDGYLADAAQAARLIAMAFDAAAMIVVACKIAVIAQLVILAAEIIAAQAAAPFTFGLSEVGALGATQATKMIVRRLLKELRDALIEAIMETLKDPIVSAVQGMISDLIAQTVNQGFGAQDGYDLGRTAKRGIEDGVDAAKNWQDTFTESLRDGVGSRAGGAVRHHADSAAGHGDGNSGTGEHGDSGNSGTGENGNGNGNRNGNGDRTGGNEGSTPNGGDNSGNGRTAPTPSSTTPGGTNTPTPHPTSPTSSTGDNGTTTRPDSAPRPAPAPTPTADHRSTDQSDPFGTRLTPDASPSPTPAPSPAPTHTAPPADQAGPQSRPQSDAPSGQAPSPDSRPAPHAQPDSAPAPDARPQSGTAPHHGGDPAGPDSRPAAHPQGDAPSGQAPSPDSRPAPHAQPDGTPTSGPGAHSQGGTPNSAPHSDSPAPHVRSDGAPTPGPDSRPQGDGPSHHASTPDARPAPHAQPDGAPTPGPGAHPQGGVPNSAPHGDGSAPTSGPSHHASTPDARPAPHAQTDGTPAPGPDSRPQGGAVPHPAPHPVGADPRGDGHEAAAPGPRPEAESRGPGRPADETSGVAPGGGPRPAPSAPSGPEHTRPAAAPQHETPGAQTPPVPGVPHVPGPAADPSRQNAEHEAPRANVQTASTAVADAPPTTRTPHADVPPQGTPQPNPATGPVATGPTGMPPVNPTAGHTSSAAPRSDRPTGATPPATTPTHRPPTDAPRPDRPVTLGQQPTTGRPDPRTAPWGRRPATPSHPDTPSRPDSAQRPNPTPAHPRSDAPSRPDGADRTPTARPDSTQRPSTVPAQPRPADHTPTAPTRDRDNPTHPADPRATDPRSTDPRATDPHAADPRSVDPRHPDSRPADSAPATHPSDSPAPAHRSDEAPAHDPSRPATADRPYGEPGGLVEPGAHDRQRVEDSVPHDADGRPQRHPDPQSDWPRAINGDPNEPGRNNNCVDVALATVDTYSGHPTPAAARTPDHDADGNPSDRGERNGRDRIENALGAKFSDLGDGPAAYRRLEDTLRRSGHGSQAVIITRDADGRAHAWNAVNHNGKITYIDAQTGRRSDQPLHSGDHGVFAVPLGPDRTPVTPDHHADPSHDTDPAHDRRAPAEAAGDSTHPDPNAPDGQPDADRPRVQRPDFMGDPPDIYGRPGLTKDQIEQIQVYRANEEAGYREQYYDKNGGRKLLATKDESGYTPPQLTQLEDGGPWVRVKDAPEAPEPHYLDPDYIPLGRDKVTDEARRDILDGFAERRQDAIDLDNKARKLRDESGLPEAAEAYKATHKAMGDATEAFGEAAARHHYIAEAYPGFHDEPLLGPANGNDQFDQVWTHPDGRVVVVEAKSSVDTDLGTRILPGSGRTSVSQGSREYFFDIIREMEGRGEVGLAGQLKKALREGKLEYLVVKGEKNSGSYTGLQYRRFDISKGTLP